VKFVVALVLAAGVAHADDYPTAVVDRPLNLLPGMTAVYATEEVSSVPDSTFGHRTPDLIVAHGFGPVEIAAEAGDFAELHASLTTHGVPESIEVYGLTGAPQKDNSLHVAQGILVGQRMHVIPGQLALAGGFGVVLSENRLPDQMGTLRWSTIASTAINARVEVQALSWLTVTAGVSGGAPLAQWGGPEFGRSVSGGAGVIVTLGTWDIYANGGVTAIPDHWLPYLAAGFSKRWGGYTSVMPGPPPSSPM
jgi:hypothetical protein